MKRTVLRLLLWMNILFFFIIYLIGCAATKPNTPFAGPYPQSFNELSAKNPLLANELAKLPEIQDGISELEETALDHFVRTYNHDSKLFNKVFQEMYLVGIPEVRKYCSPLQALFWLAEDGKKNSINKILDSYSLDMLLEKAWVFDKSSETEPYIKVLQMTEDQIKSIVSSLNKDKQEFYEGMSAKTINDVILIQYKDNPRYFPRKIRKTIKSSLKNKPNKNYKNYVRWKDFTIVADRLNAPEVIHFYINNNFRYRYGDFPPAYTTFKRKFGNCTALADFGKFLLERAGYKTFVRSAKWGKPRHGWHTVSGIIDNETYLIVVDFSSSGTSISGPYKNTEELDKHVSLGKIKDRMWGHPPGPWY